MKNAYDRFITMTREIRQLGTVAELLAWDQETYMPKKGIALRAEQLSTMASVAHERLSSDEFGTLLRQLDEDIDDPVRATNIREMRRFYDRAVRVPAELVARIAKTTTLAKEAWVKAREASDFALFAPHLKELFELKRQMADCIGYQGERYDALLDEFEPGMTTAMVADIFASLRKPLADFVQRLADAPNQPDASIVRRHYPRAAQEAFGRRLAEAIGFDFDAGRLDVSTHPFCSGAGPLDVRMTARYYEDYVNASIFGILHETGHGLYEQGQSIEHCGTPTGAYVSLGIHESQSRLWENMVGRSRAFWEKFYPECQAAFPDALTDTSLDAFHGAINCVGPSCIRVEADEVTYNLHIVLRFEIERALLDRRLDVKDVPDAWNEKMRTLLGITPANTAEGCLQDIHWSLGAIGYFPTYALGNLYAAQMFEAATEAVPDLEGAIRRGDTGVLLSWLRENVHAHGMRYRAAELIERVSGRPLSIEPFMNYIERKFAPIYDL